ncbi:hypothetical protein GCM10011574_36500 [Microbispora bryophytorum]|uniref:Secreted protein n=1 Tax=Microbispora bryophytorum TaxID=1460882 RepID=A0A8H9H5C5_9ACTN|nr:hypothetical protein GCM10011574_36500 [Microbispora bryophytorum]
MRPWSTVMAGPLAAWAGTAAMAVRATAAMAARNSTESLQKGVWKSSAKFHACLYADKIPLCDRHHLDPAV